MTHFIRVAATFALLTAFFNTADAADTLSDKFVGTWKARKEITNPMPRDSMFEFSQDGVGEVSVIEKGKRIGSEISWKIDKAFGNACILVIDYVGAPEGVRPLKLLVAFDGNDTIVTQGKNSGIGFFDRQKSPGS